MVRQAPSLAEPRLTSLSHGRVAAALGLGSVIAVGAFARATLLDQVMRRDEAQTYMQFADSFSSALTDYSQPNNHILHSLLVRMSTLVFGGEPWAIRLPAFLFGVALIGVVYWWVASLAGRRAGLLAAALVAGSSMMIEYSTIARGYTMVAVAFVVLMELSRRILLQTGNWLWAGWVIVSVFGFATVPVFVFPFLAVVTWLALNIICWLHLRRHLVFPGSAALVAVPVLAILVYLPAAMESGLQAIVANDFVASRPWSQLPDAWRLGVDDLLRWLVRDGIVALPCPPWWSSVPCAVRRTSSVS